jgi:4-hydroxybenzoate polyprenyltransferase
MAGTVGELLREIRLKQWIKDVFVFAPLVFSRSFLRLEATAQAAMICLAFCLVSSAVYAFNDTVDRKKDRRHPQKRDRPIASGRLSVGTALALAGGLLLAGMGIALAVRPAAAAVVAAYVGLNVLYSLVLKNLVFIDVIVIATGFLLRVTAGAVAIRVPLSHWMLLATFFLAIFLGFGKRRKEMLVTHGAVGHRAVFRHYSVELLNCLISASSALTIITYALYVVLSRQPGDRAGLGLLFTVPLVVFAVFRYLYLIYRADGGGEPGELLLSDRVSLVAIGIWAAAVLLLLGLAGRTGAAP